MVVGERSAAALCLVLVAVFSTPSVVLAQEGGCELWLQTASQLFDTGRFSAAEEHIAECLQGEPRRAEKVQAYSMLTKIHLAKDDLLPAEASLTRLLSADPDFEPDLFDSPRFVRMVAEAKRRSLTPTVTSVSKSKESLLEAPATVMVITAAEIERRGYLDLEAILHDLPGFDFSRFYGVPYANIYQRGYRSADTTRTLLLIDGVEDNDLFSQVPYISRQFPLSMIERIEVVHGPASTMYGANAFAGVINIITKEPEQLIADGKKIGYDVWLTGGSWGTGVVDGIVAGQTESGSMSWSLMARRYESDEFDLSDYSDWDYDPDFYNGVDYQALSSLSTDDADTVAGYIEAYGYDQVSRYFDIIYDAAGVPIGMNLNQNGEDQARALDQAGLDQIVNGHPMEFTNPTEDWLLYGKLKTSNMVFGLQTYSRAEGLNPPVTDTFTAAGENGAMWTTEHIFMYMKYFQRFLDDRLTMNIFTRYKKHDIDSNGTAFVTVRSYHRQRLGIGNLLDETEAFWGASYRYRATDQLRSELSLFYDHSERFNVVGGLELRYSSIPAQNINSTEQPASETGYTWETIPGGNQITSRDVGAYVQASYRPWMPLKLVAGARFDNNKVREYEGYGTVFNPRLGIIYSWRDFVFKAIYSEAFQDAPNFQKYETSTGWRELSAPDLKPEEVSNIELSAGWNPRDDLGFTLVGYQAEYKDIVEEVSGVPCDHDGCTSDTTRQFQNRGRLEIKGVQAEARWTPEPLRLFANYTYTDPYNPDVGARVGDIADHRLNLIGEVSFFDEKLDCALRVNGVFGRKTGEGTTVATNPYTEIEDYTVAHVAVTYRNILPGLDIQLAVNNLFDTEYFDPGYRDADGGFYASRIPQPDRSIFLSIRASR